MGVLAKYYWGVVAEYAGGRGWRVLLSVDPAASACRLAAEVRERYYVPGISHDGHRHGPKGLRDTYRGSRHEPTHSARQARTAREARPASASKGG